MVYMKPALSISSPLDVANGCDSDLLDIPKEPTPLLGSWADVWSSRQASEIILEKAKDDEAPEEGRDSASSTDERVTTHAQLSVGGHPPTIATAAHPRHIFRHDPYNIKYSRADMFLCTCSDCVTAIREAHAELARRRAAARLSPLHTIGAHSELEPPSPLKLASSVGSTFGGCAVDGGFQAHSSTLAALRKPTRAPTVSAAPVEVGIPSQIPVEHLSCFMPPPPPSVITAEILSRDGTPESVALVKRIMDRWYSKVCAAQVFFVGTDSLCPAPEDFVLLEWHTACVEWWFYHFEFAQMKPFHRHARFHVDDSPIHSQPPAEFVASESPGTVW